MTEPKTYQNLFAELKRRRVFKSAALYGGVAFVVFQAADFVVPALHLPEIVSTGIVLFALAGFPIAMWVAWFFDVTSGGMRRTNPPERGELEAIVAQSKLRRWPAGIGALIGVLLLACGVWLDLGGSDLFWTPGIPLESPHFGSVAVLPFADLFGVEGDAHLGEGIANDLLEALGRVPGLRVTGQTSAFSFGDGRIDIPSIGEELNVAFVLEGGVGDAGDQVEVALRLVAGDDDDNPWNKTFLLPKEGFLSSLDSVAWTVAAQLGAEVPEEGRGLLVPMSTENFTAYRDYLQGRYLSRKVTPDALRSAIESFNKTVLLDSDFTPAWSAMAMAYVLLPQYGGPPITEILPYVEAALERALVPGEETSEGYAVSAYLHWVYHWDQPQAEADFLKALNIEPENPLFLDWFARFLVTERRWEEALEISNRAVEFDPLSPSAHMARGMALFCAGLPGASESLRQALELAPDMHPAAYILAGHLALEGDLEGAEKEFDRFASLTGTDPSAFRAYLAALSDPSRRSEAVAALTRPGFFGSLQGAELLAHLGENDAALSLLEQSARSRSPYMPWINALPQFATLRNDPRFQGILAWVGS